MDIMVGIGGKRQGKNQKPKGKKQKYMSKCKKAGCGQSIAVSRDPLSRSSRDQTGLDKTLTPQRNRLGLINIHRIRTTAISLLSLFRGREIACSESKKLRYCCRADQTPRQITTIWHVVCLTQSGALCHNLLKRTLRYDHFAQDSNSKGLIN